MNLLMISWEYPPKNIGGLSNHVYNLSKSLKELGHDVHVLTCSEGDAAFREEDNGVIIHRVVPYNLPSEDFTKWVMHLNFAMLENAIKLMNSIGKFDIIHCHDWHSFYVGKALKNAYNIPLVTTIHATEHGRNGGIKNELQNYISSVEWWLTYDSWKLIVCSDTMKDEVKSIFKIPEDKMFVIPNGINLKEYEIGFDTDSFRRKYASENEKLVIYVGRHVYEKGIQLLIEAVPDILSSSRDIKFIIVGQGNLTEELRQKVKVLGLEDKVIFTGYIQDEDKIRLLKVANAAVFPSYYEPFGIVALEAMAAKCPVVVSDIGGLGEIVKHRQNGIKFICGSKDSLKESLLDLLGDNNLAETVSEKSYNDLKEVYSWENIARQTLQVYEKIKEETKGTDWEIAEERPKKRSSKAKKITEKQVDDSVLMAEVAASEINRKQELEKPKRTRKKS